MVNPNTDGMDPTALTIQQAAKLLRTKDDVIRRHITEGLPTGPDGRINLVTYAAWLNLPEDEAVPESGT